ncbi:5-formyltetrahydrofolate cyclo-ligase [Salinibacillus aidingensis]|uniref:5-formyltetrahydrofolate cyclo-ligase n=1 Tax=Salinibacillus aidingensis TaxID=237684 RepID=A0ABP3KMA4_9BACI
MDKKELRRQGIQNLKSLSETQRAHLSKKISNHVIDTEWFHKADIIGVTVSKSFELDTSYLIHKAWETGKKVCVPKCYPNQNHHMKFFIITSFDQLERVYAGLLEPDPDQTVKIPGDQIDLLIVPGIWFDREGYRTGFGGGYYDRFLKDFKHVTISLAANSQILPAVPRDDYDMPVQHLVTEDGVLF